MLSRFFSYCHWLPWNPSFGTCFGCYALGCCFYMGGSKVFKFVIRGMSFRCLRKSIKLVSYNCRILIAYITIGKWGPVIRWRFNCLFLISNETQVNLYLNNSVIGRYSFKREVRLTVKYFYRIKIICTQLYGFKYSYPILIFYCFMSLFLLNNSHLFSHIHT